MKNDLWRKFNIVDYINFYDLIGDFFINYDFLDDLDNGLFVNFYYRFLEYNKFYENEEVLDKFLKKVFLKINYGMSLIDFLNKFIIS